MQFALYRVSPNEPHHPTLYMKCFVGVWVLFWDARYDQRQQFSTSKPEQTYDEKSGDIKQASIKNPKNFTILFYCSYFESGRCDDAKVQKKSFRFFFLMLLCSNHTSALSCHVPYFEWTVRENKLNKIYTKLIENEESQTLQKFFVFETFSSGILKEKRLILNTCA